MNMSVTGGQVKSFYIGMNPAAGNGCTFDLESIDGSGNYDLASPPAPFIRDDRFTIYSVAPAISGTLGTVKFTMNGTFNGTRVTGDGSFDFVTSSCSAHVDLTWELTQQ